MYRLCIALVLFSAGFYTNTAFAGDLLSAKAKVESTCQTCHGMDGLGTIAGVPNLSGQKKDYLVIQLKAFRGGQRQHAQMSIIAQMLSDEDIDNVSEWYSRIKITVELAE